MQVSKISSSTNYRDKSKTNFKGLNEQEIFRATLNEFGFNNTARQAIKEKNSVRIKDFFSNVISVLEEKYKERPIKVQHDKYPEPNEQNIIEKLSLKSNHERISVSLTVDPKREDISLNYKEVRPSKELSNGEDANADHIVYGVNLDKQEKYTGQKAFSFEHVA